MDRDNASYNSISGGYIEAAVQAGYINGDVHNNVTGPEQLAAALRQVRQEEMAQQRAEREQARRAERARQKVRWLVKGLLGIGIVLAASSMVFGRLAPLLAAGPFVAAALYVGMVKGLAKEI